MFSHKPIAMDRSARRVDADGHMHVEMTNISKANVCPYFGREIPDFQRLGLDANRVYMLYRDPAELAAAAATFAGKPLLLHHQPVNADEPAPELVVGTIGTDVAFKHPYLQASMSLWTREAIDAVESESQRELSPGYRYRADMTRGVSPEGVAFDGIMRDIMGNHVALVAEGRTGPDVMVADDLPKELTMSMRFPRLLAALAVVLPSMKPEQAVAMDAALAEDLKEVPGVKHCVEDEFPDLTADERTEGLSKYAKDAGKELAAMSDEDKREGYKRAAADKAVRAAAANTAKQAANLAADEAAVSAKVTEAVAAATAGMVSKDDAKLAQDAAVAAVHELYTARKAVEPTVGMVALDSAEAVYRFALDHLKVDHKETQAAGLPALYDASVKAATPVVALDAAPFDPSILGLSHIRKG